MFGKVGDSDFLVGEGGGPWQRRVAKRLRREGSVNRGMNLLICEMKLAGVDRGTQVHRTCLPSSNAIS